MSLLRIYSLNIQTLKHLHRFPERIRTLAPHVVFLQEVTSADAEGIADMLGVRLVQHVPMTRTQKPGVEEYEWGLACYVAADVDVVSCEATIYADTGENTPVLDQSTGRCNRFLQKLVVNYQSETFCLLQTHFTWSPHGVATDMQEEDLAVLQGLLRAQSEFALFGDSNIPRGVNHLWEALARKYTDNVPAHMSTSLDPLLHRVGHLPRMVDMCFTTHHYRVDTIHFDEGMSDHQGMFVELSKAATSDEKHRAIKNAANETFRRYEKTFKDLARYDQSKTQD